MFDMFPFSSASVLDLNKPRGFWVDVYGNLQKRINGFQDRVIKRIFQNSSWCCDETFPMLRHGDSYNLNVIYGQPINSVDPNLNWPIVYHQLFK